MLTKKLLYDVTQRAGVTPFASKLYWQLILGSHLWRYRARVGDIEVRFKTTTKTEYLRASTFFGEREVLEHFVADLEPSDIVWDVGATVGTYACFAAAAVTDGYVVAIEPEPTNRARLVTNLSMNAPMDRYRVRAVALTDEDGIVQLERGTVEAGRGHHFLSTNGQGIPVAGFRGDSLITPGTPAPNVLKIDVQGAELKVLYGMGDLLDDVERIYVELHVEKCRRYGTTVSEVEAFLVKNGFSITRLGEPDYNRRGVYHVIASR